jgi:hypothetical protein
MRGAVLNATKIHLFPEALDLQQKDFCLLDLVVD